LNASACNVEVRFMDLDTDELAVKLDTRNACGSASHIRIENGATFVRQLLDTPTHQRNRFLGRMFSFDVVSICIYDATVLNSHHFVISRRTIFPCQLEW